MAVLSVVERLGHDFEFAAGQVGPLRTFSRYFWVYCDTKDESPEAVRIAAGLPQMGATHPNDSGSIIQSVRVRRDEEHPKRWEVELQYSSENIRNKKDKEETEADLERVSIQTRQGQRLIDRRLDGTAIVNSAGDLIEGLMVPWNSLSIVIEQYTLTAPDYYVLSKWINAINSATWRGVPAYFAQIESLNYEETKSPIDGTVDCWKRTATVKLAHPDQDTYGFRLHVLDAGLRELVSGSMKYIRDDKTASFISRPVPLDGAGQKNFPMDPPVFFNASPFPELPFATLGI